MLTSMKSLGVISVFIEWVAAAVVYDKLQVIKAERFNE